ncbi:hypothetical protein LNKW23_39830 [Paralimibaculum aggregatum]|uniref:Uncharacterized protein n=1 Tax=Paralimibaculum aggregatum TaxID=3036245 RepID=A0ABQ6LNH0_9RHOB|nr:hypothetical protein [Limibaculum sp. NKW23]GMG84767.1 hypothetical protein LNKW23_39830 [Limibaculum sp. NKW23]
MFPLLFRAVLVVGLLTAIYIALAAYMRWDKRRSLEEAHDSGAAPGLSREDFVSKGLAAYERSWEKRALYGVFLLPLVVGMIVGTIAWFA